MMERFRPDERGANAVEFALILPVLIIMIMGAVEFALIVYAYNAAGHVAWDVTRRLATNQILSSQAAASAKAQLPRLIQSEASVTTSSSSSDPNTNRYTVTITFPAKSATPTNVLGWAYGSLNVTAKTTMQQEPTS